MKKMYIAVLGEVGDFMVPTLVAHAVLDAHLHFEHDGRYEDWLYNSFKKVVLRVNRKEFEKIRSTMDCYESHENTTLNAEKSCLVVIPVDSENVPNVLKFAKMGDLMNKWIKPSELPENFHGSCWVCYKGFYAIYEPTCEIVQKHYNNGRAEYFRDGEGHWEYLSDESYRVLPLEVPEVISEEEWEID